MGVLDIAMTSSEVHVSFAMMYIVSMQDCCHFGINNSDNLSSSKHPLFSLPLTQLLRIIKPISGTKWSIVAIYFQQRQNKMLAQYLPQIYSVKFIIYNKTPTAFSPFTDGLQHIFAW